MAWVSSCPRICDARRFATRDHADLNTYNPEPWLTHVTCPQRSPDCPMRGAIVLGRAAITVDIPSINEFTNALSRSGLRAVPLAPVSKMSP